MRLIVYKVLCCAALLTIAVVAYAQDAGRIKLEDNTQFGMSLGLVVLFAGLAYKVGAEAQRNSSHIADENIHQDRADAMQRFVSLEACETMHTGLVTSVASIVKALGEIKERLASIEAATNGKK